MIRTVLAGVALVLFAATPSGMAQVFKDGPHVGFVGGGDTEDPDPAVGWQVAYEYTDLLTLEIAVTRMTDTMNGESLGVGPFPAEGEAELTLWNLAVSARAGTLLGDRTYVYVGAGFGYYSFTEEDMDSVKRSLFKDPVPAARGGTISNAKVDLEDGFGYHAAVGAEFLIIPSWECFIEYRIVSLSTDSELTLVETVLSEDEVPSRFDYKRDGTFDYNHGVLRLGVNYRF